MQEAVFDDPLPFSVQLLILKMQTSLYRQESPSTGLSLCVHITANSNVLCNFIYEHC